MYMNAGLVTVNGTVFSKNTLMGPCWGGPVGLRARRVVSRRRKACRWRHWVDRAGRAGSVT